MSKILVPLDEFEKIILEHFNKIPIANDADLIAKWHDLKEKYKSTPYKYKDHKAFCNDNDDSVDYLCSTDCNCCKDLFQLARELKDE